MGALAVPTFATPAPITAHIELVMSDVSIVATDRADTVVEIRPSDSSRRSDVQAAEQTRVEFSAGTLLVKATGRWRSWSPFGYGGSVDVEIGLPAASRVTAATVGALRCAGVLGDCEVKTAVGDIQIEAAGGLRVSTSAGDIAVERVSGDAYVTTASGTIRLGEIDGAAEIKNSNGDTHVREITGELRVKAANGDIAIERAHASVTAKTANGDIRVGAPASGSVDAGTALGTVEISIPDGTAAWLDLNTEYGQLHNDFAAGEPPDSGEDRLEVRARTSYGDITIRRAYPLADAPSVA
jgi:Putative adhesin